MRVWKAIALYSFAACVALAAEVSGRIADPQGQPIPGATVQLRGPDGAVETKTDAAGRYEIHAVAEGNYELSASSPGLAPVRREVAISSIATFDLQFTDVTAKKDSVVITATSTEPTLDLRNSEVFDRTLFTRDDQVFHQLNSGIDLGQHEG